MGKLFVIEGIDGSGKATIDTWRLRSDAFAPRNIYALNIDERTEPPMFQISDTHYAATWLLDPRAPQVEMPQELKARIERMKKEGL